MEKRKYENRDQEFLDMTVDQIQGVIKDLKKQIKECDEKLVVVSAEPTPDNEILNAIKREKTDANNKRVRAYSRLRKLGYSAKDTRAKNAAMREAAKGGNTPIVPESAIPASEVPQNS